MTPALQRIADAFSPLFARAEVTPLPFGRFDVLLRVMPWADVKEAEAIVTLGIFASAPEVGFRVRAQRMPWSEFAARVLFVATVVAALLTIVWCGP